jgi:hypothetical protein
MKNRESRDLAEARERVERAKRYALACPSFVRPTDLKFQTLEWQLGEVKRFNERCAPQK